MGAELACPPKGFVDLLVFFQKMNRSSESSFTIAESWKFGLWRGCSRVSVWNTPGTSNFRNAVVKTIRYVENPIFRFFRGCTFWFSNNRYRTIIYYGTGFISKGKKRVGFITTERNRDLLFGEGTWLLEGRNPFHPHSGAWWNDNRNSMLQ